MATLAKGSAGQNSTSFPASVVMYKPAGSEGEILIRRPSHPQV
jgi:hypothetical protein